MPATPAQEPVTTTLAPTFIEQPTEPNVHDELRALVAAGRAMRVERRRLEAAADRAIARYGERVPGLAAAVSLIEDRQAIELACEIMDLVAAARAA